MNKIVTAIAKIMSEVGSVKKDGENKFHNYKYATAADIQHKLQPLLAREGLVIIQNETNSEFWGDGAVLAITYEFGMFHKDGEIWPDRPRYTGTAAARNTKGGFDDKALNKCHTAARKYFLLGLFQIPTGDYDDADEQEDRPAQKAVAPRKEAPPITPPAHPETGEVSPHAIAFDCTAVEWGGKYIAAIKTARNDAELTAWRDANDDTLIRLQTEAPKAFGSITQATLKKAQTLGQLEAAE